MPRSLAPAALTVTGSSSVGSGDWPGTVSGSVEADAVTLSVQAAARIDGTTCDSGPLTFTIPPLKNAL